MHQPGDCSQAVGLRIESLALVFVEQGCSKPPQQKQLKWTSRRCSRRRDKEELW